MTDEEFVTVDNCNKKGWNFRRKKTYFFFKKAWNTVEIETV